MLGKAPRIDQSGWYPYPREWLWRLLEQRELLGLWLMPNDFVPEVGHTFRLNGTPMKRWRGYVDCEVLEIKPEKRLVISWQEMEHHNPTRVTFTVSNSTREEARLRVLHEGFDRTMGFWNGLAMRQRTQIGWRNRLTKAIPQILEYWDTHGEGAQIPADLVQIS